MTYPNNIVNLLESIGFEVDEDFICGQKRDGEIFIRWLGEQSVPKETLLSYADDSVQLPASAGKYEGKLFSEYDAEHGGDPEKTIRRQVVEAIQNETSNHWIIIRGIVKILANELKVTEDDMLRRLETVAFDNVDPTTNTGWLKFKNFFRLR